MDCKNAYCCLITQSCPRRSDNKRLMMNKFNLIGSLTIFPHDLTFRKEEGVNKAGEEREN